MTGENMKRAFLAALLLASLPAASEVESYTIDPRHTFPAYEVNHLTFSIQRGRFNKTRGKIALDLAAGTGSAEVVIETGSVSSGLEQLDQRLRGEDFFDVAKYPEMTFKSTELVFEGERLRQARGTLTINGIAKPVTFEVTHFKCGLFPLNMKKVCGADMSTTIKRSDFGIKYLLPTLGDEVLLRVNVEAIKDS
jgi:polyisoprenoid-binding protein YceI